MGAELTSEAADNNTSHAAEAAALGFYYQSLYALRAVLLAPHDDTAVCLERLDDVEILANGQPLLVQLKHSMSQAPAPISLSSRALWKTLKAWIDVLPKVALSETRFQLVTVAQLGAGSALDALMDDTQDRTALVAALLQEAQRVVDEHRQAKANGVQPATHADRVRSCTAFLALDERVRRSMVDRITIFTGASKITEISGDIAATLVNFPPDQREAISTRLIEWWDLQVVLSLCDRRDRAISRLEVLQQVSTLAGEIARAELIADYEVFLPPEDHVADSMIARQIELVGGTKHEIRAAERDEWRARSQRHRWITERVDMASRIELYDDVLREAWQDKHGVMTETCEAADDKVKRSRGLELFRWVFNDAHSQVRPFARNWSATYYVRGSYQVMATRLSVGWHPNFAVLLGGKAP